MFQQTIIIGNLGGGRDGAAPGGNGNGVTAPIETMDEEEVPF